MKVYRLITRNSYEREMLDKASLKLGLDRAVLQSMSGNKDSSVNGVRLSAYHAHTLQASFTLYGRSLEISARAGCNLDTVPLPDPAVFQERD